MFFYEIGNSSRIYYIKSMRIFALVNELKEVLESHVYEEGVTGSPKFIIKTAYKVGMITDEELWIRGLQSRNNVAHAYNHEIALDIISQAKAEYYDMFCELKKEIDEKWI